MPSVLDTDVNGALEAEMTMGAGRGLDRVAYVTVGTGIGVGIKTGSSFAARPFHPELGHIRVERHQRDGDFQGHCSFHGGCLEGLCAAPALIARFGALERLSKKHEAWDLAGFYLAQLCLALCLGYRVERIILGGGVLEAEGVLRSVREHFASLMNSYLADQRSPDNLITSAALGTEAGLLGAILLASRPA